MRLCSAKIETPILLKQTSQEVSTPKKRGRKPKMLEVIDTKPVRQEQLKMKMQEEGSKKTDVRSKTQEEGSKKRDLGFGTRDMTNEKQEERSKTQDTVPNVTHSILQESTFGTQVASFLKNGGIQIMEVFPGKNGKEFDLILKVPSPIGTLLMYSKAKDKKKIGDADLSVAFVEGQVRNLPVIYLSNGILDKGMDTELEKRFKGLTFKTI